MSDPVLTTNGLRHLVEEGRETGVTLQCKLFKDTAPHDESAEDGDFTWCDFSGYSEQTLTRGSITTTDPTHVEYDLSPALFAHDGGGVANDVIGYVVSADGIGGGGSDVALWFEIFDTPKTMAILGDVITVIDTVEGEALPPP